MPEHVLCQGAADDITETNEQNTGRFSQKDLQSGGIIIDYSGKEIALKTYYTVYNQSRK
jgi:hypothetical protein